MNDKGDLGKLRECFNQSNFFSTQVSSPSRSLLQKEATLRRLPSRFVQEPQLHLSKVKQRYKEVEGKFVETLRGTVKARSELERLERDVAVSRFHFLKLYNAKKFRLDEHALLSSYRTDKDFAFNIALQRTRQQRILDGVSISSRKEEQFRRIEDLSESNRQDRNSFRETLKATQERIKQQAEGSAEKVRKERVTFQIKKKNLADLSLTKSKFNYLSRVNQEMQAIKEYQQLVEQVEESAETAREQRSFSRTYANSFR